MFAIASDILSFFETYPTTTTTTTDATTAAVVMTARNAAGQTNQNNTTTTVDSTNPRMEQFVQNFQQYIHDIVDEVQIGTQDNNVMQDDNDDLAIQLYYASALSSQAPQAGLTVVQYGQPLAQSWMEQVRKDDDFIITDECPPEDDQQEENPRLEYMGQIRLLIENVPPELVQEQPEILEQGFSRTYNQVTGMCQDPYQRTVLNTTLADDWTFVVQDQDLSYAAINFTTMTRCSYCSPFEPNFREPLDDTLEEMDVVAASSSIDNTHRVFQLIHTDHNVSCCTVSMVVG